MARVRRSAPRCAPVKAPALAALAATLLWTWPDYAVSAWQQTAYRASTDVVTIEVSVERRNRPVQGLVASDFELLDNGVRQTIDLLPSDALPLDISLVVDQSGVGQNTFNSRFWNDLRLAMTSLHPTDRVRVIRFATEVTEDLAMSPVGEWAERTRLAFGGEADRLAQRRNRGSGQDYVHDPLLRKASASDALLLALARPRELARRHTIVAFLLGGDGGSVLWLSGVVPLLAARSDALLHVGLWQTRFPDWTSSYESRYQRREFAAAAEATGGRVHSVTNLVATFRDVIENLRRSYVLRYTLTGVAPGGWHGVDVRLPRHASYQVRARQGYVGR